MIKNDRLYFSLLQQLCVKCDICYAVYHKEKE
jgi:hypothetical protein